MIALGSNLEWFDQSSKPCTHSCVVSQQPQPFFSEWLHSFCSVETAVSTEQKECNHSEKKGCGCCETTQECVQGFDDWSNHSKLLPRAINAPGPS